MPVITMIGSSCFELYKKKADIFDTHVMGYYSSIQKYSTLYTLVHNFAER